MVVSPTDYWGYWGFNIKIRELVTRNEMGPANIPFGG